MATYVNDLRLKEIATGDESGTWGTSTNTNLELIAEKFGAASEALSDASTATITMADGTSDAFRSLALTLTGSLSQACTVTLAPNTLSNVWIVKNSAGDAVTLTQGTGANVTIPSGDTKVVYTDGAGSGAVVADAFASLSVVDLKVQDDLTVTDDLIVNGDIDLAGSIDVDGTANLDIVDIDGATQADGTITVGVDDTGYDVKFFGATSGSYMLWDESADDLILAGAAGLTVAGVLTGASLDISGDIDIDGTANLDVVDIDGAVDMASTLAVAGVLTGASLDISGDIDIDGTSNLDIVDIDGAVDMATTLAVAGNVDFNGDLDVAGTVTMPSQPAFSAQTSAAITDVATDGSNNTVKFGTEIFDQNADFNTTTFTFTAPVTGKYQLNANVYMLNSDAECTYIRVQINTSNRNYSNIIDPEWSADRGEDTLNISVLADMDASDTAIVVVRQYEGTAQMDVPASINSNFSGYLVA
jgi:cytoskeletal protein CcmA (bactofilin family)